MCIFVTLFSLGAAVTDLWKGKIYNKYLMGSAGVGILIRIMREGIHVLPQCLGVAGLTFLLLIPVYLLRALGGGDIKMLSVAALFFTRTDLVCICMTALTITLSIGILRMISNRLQGKRSLTTIAFAVPFFCAICFSVFSRPLGW